MGYEQVEDRGPFRFLVTALSRQQSQRRQGHWERSAAHHQQGNHRFEDGGQYLADEQYLPGRTVPPIPDQAGGSGGNQGYGSQVGPLSLSHAALRHAVRGPRSGVLRGSTPQLADQLSQTESRPTRIPNHCASRSLKLGVEFLERRKPLAFAAGAV